MSYPNLGSGWEIAHADLPVVQIICRDKDFEERLTIHEDWSGQQLHVVLDVCEQAYLDWIEKRWLSKQ